MNHDPLNPVTEQDVEEFRRDGAICLRGMYDPAWLELLSTAIETARARPGRFAQDHSVEGEAAAAYSDLAMSHWIPEFRRYALEGPGPSIAASLMQATRINFFYDALWVKEAGTSRATPWHHDQSVYQVDGNQLCLIWLPLEPVAREVCIEFVAGSQDWGRLFRPERINGGWYGGADLGDGLEFPPDVNSNREDYRILGWDMQPGDCIVFGGMTLHGAPGNLSAVRRAAVSTVWMGDDTTYIERVGEMQPYFEGHGLVPGDPMDCEYFPRAWPRTGGEASA